MIIALVFNWSVFDRSENYWNKIREVVFRTDIIQRSGRHMKLSIGDVLVGLQAGQDAEVLFEEAFNRSDWCRFYEDRLQNGFPTIFGMVFENMTCELAEEMHVSLAGFQPYIGALSVHLERAPHLALYRNSLPPKYRLQGRRLRSFFSMGSKEGCDERDLTAMCSLGYGDVDFEDTGASRTIFDEFDTSRHFVRVAAFRSMLLGEAVGSEGDAYELTMMLEDLSPRLFNALGAAAERLLEAENEEEMAQVSVSGRRYMEQLADVLFPSSSETRNGRSLNKAAYKNRLWAFAEDAVEGDADRLVRIGKEIDRVVSELNSGVHSNRSKENVTNSIRDAVKLTVLLFSLKPSAAQNGYLAYTDSLRAFVEGLRETDGPGG